MEATKAMGMENIKVAVIAKETIKPSSPTPHHLTTYKLSFRDQIITPNFYIGMVFFYSAACGDDESKREISQRLKKSLSETLTCFYPLAGRLRDNNVSIDCNDEGADYLEAEVNNCRLSDILDQPKAEVINPLAPAEPSDSDYCKIPLLLVQANFFPCGGVAVFVCMTHKIADGVSFAAFVKAWSCTALGSPDTLVPDFSAASSRFPPREDIPVSSVTFKDMIQNSVVKRFVVDASNIATLKAKASSARVQQPTRVEAVTALFWKCAAAASKRLGGSSPKTYQLMGAVNLRAKLSPPLPEHSFGNVVGSLWAMLDGDNDDNDDQNVSETRNDLPELVCRLRKGIEESTDNGKKGAKLRQLKGDDDIVTHYHASWCRFPAYEIDFGWGKPTWVTRDLRIKGLAGIHMMDARDGVGVEIWMTLIEEEMDLFEADPELLAYASINPSAL